MRLLPPRAIKLSLQSKVERIRAKQVPKTSSRAVVKRSYAVVSYTV